MQSLSIEHPTPKQLLKLKRGEKVRLARGTGFNVLVHPETYNLVARAFNKGNAYTYGLSEDELKANMGLGPGLQRMQKFDNAGNPLPDIDPATRIQVGQAPTAVAPQPGSTGNGLRDHLGAHGAKHMDRARTLAGQVEQAKNSTLLNHHLGTNFDYMGRAGIDKAVSDNIASKLSEASFAARYPVKPKSDDVVGMGFHHPKADRTLSGRGIIMHHNQVAPPAYVSQPFNENFNMNAQLPPDFQLNRIHGEGFHKDKHYEDFPESVVMPPAYQSKAEDVDFVRQSTKHPDSKPEARHKKNKAIRKSKTGSGLYAGGSSGHGLGP